MMRYLLVSPNTVYNMVSTLAKAVKCLTKHLAQFLNQYSYQGIHHCQKLSKLQLLKNNKNLSMCLFSICGYGLDFFL